QDRLELWSLSGSAPSPLPLSPAAGERGRGEGAIQKDLQWIPYDSLKGGDRDVRWAAFVDAKRLATISNSGQLVLWELATAKPLYHLAAQAGSTPALSPDRKYLAFSLGKEIGILDV